MTGETKTFLRKPFGISSAREVMQKRNEEAFADIQGVNVVAYDLIIAARNVIEHNAIMHRVLKRAGRENALFNAGEIQFKVTTVTYMGNIVTKDGMRPDPDKFEAIVNMPKPTDKHGLLLLLGMDKYCRSTSPRSRASPHLCDRY